MGFSATIVVNETHAHEPATRYYRGRPTPHIAASGHEAMVAVAKSRSDCRRARRVDQSAGDLRTLYDVRRGTRSVGTRIRPEWGSRPSHDAAAILPLHPDPELA